MTIRSAVVELLHAERRTDTVKLIGELLQFLVANAPRKDRKGIGYEEVNWIQLFQRSRLLKTPKGMFGSHKSSKQCSLITLVTSSFQDRPHIIWSTSVLLFNVTKMICC